MEERIFSALFESQKHHWWYAARRKILDEVLRTIGQQYTLPQGRIYDLGCGVGANLPMLERHGSVVGIESSAAAVAFCRERGHEDVREGRLEDLGSLPARDAKIVVLADVLEHLDDEEACVSGIWELLAPGGVALITVPAFMFLWGPSDEAAHHRRRYRKKELLELFRPQFELIRATYFNTNLFPLVVAGRLWEKWATDSGDRFAHVPNRLVNTTLEAIFSAESSLVLRTGFPFGSSLLAVVRRPHE